MNKIEREENLEFYKVNIVESGEFDKNNVLVSGTREETRHYNHSIFGTDKYPLKVIKKVVDKREFEEVQVEFPAFYFEGTITETPSRDNAISLVSGQLIILSGGAKYTYNGDYNGFLIQNGTCDIETNSYRAQKTYKNGEQQPESLIEFSQTKDSFFGTYKLENGEFIFVNGRYTCDGGKTIHDGEWENYRIKNGTLTKKLNDCTITNFYKDFELVSVKDEYKDGRVYEGLVDSSGNKTKGKTTYPNGTILECDNSQTLTDKNAKITTVLDTFKIVYNGEIKNGLKDGYGQIEIYENRNGEWVHSCKYCGNFVQDVFKSGTMTTFDESKEEEYTVSIQEDCKHGEIKSNDGKFFYSGEMYRGLMPNGYGILIEDGATYEGEFVMGEKNGKGKFVSRSGKITEGLWENGKQKV